MNAKLDPDKLATSEASLFGSTLFPLHNSLTSPGQFNDVSTILTGLLLFANGQNVKLFTKGAPAMFLYSVLWTLICGN